VVGTGPPREAKSADRAGDGHQHAGRRGGGHAVTTQDEHRSRRAGAGTDRKLTQCHHRDEDRDCVEERSIDADRVEQQPVAEDLREHGYEHEADHTAPPAAAAQNGEPTPKLAALADGEVS
jgi:hypothetical protein